MKFLSSLINKGISVGEKEVFLRLEIIWKHLSKMEDHNGTDLN